MWDNVTGGIKIEGREVLLTGPKCLILIIVYFESTLNNNTALTAVIYK